MLRATDNDVCNACDGCASERVRYDPGVRHERFPQTGDSGREAGESGVTAELLGEFFPKAVQHVRTIGKPVRCRYHKYGSISLKRGRNFAG